LRLAATVCSAAATERLDGSSRRRWRPPPKSFRRYPAPGDRFDSRPRLAAEAQYPSFNAPLWYQVGDPVTGSPGSQFAKLLLTSNDAAIVGIDRHHKRRHGASRSRTVLRDDPGVPIKHPLRSRPSPGRQQFKSDRMRGVSNPVQITANKSLLALVLDQADHKRGSTHAPSRERPFRLVSACSPVRRGILRREPVRGRLGQTGRRRRGPID
jgi:hypothetical protein